MRYNAPAMHKSSTHKSYSRFHTMRLSRNKNHPDYHSVVLYVDKILLNGLPVEHCVHVDLGANKVECTIMPIRAPKGWIETQFWYGDVQIVWQEPKPAHIALFQRLKSDWERREEVKSTIKSKEPL